MSIITLLEMYGKFEELHLDHAEGQGTRGPISNY